MPADRPAYVLSTHCTRAKNHWRDHLTEITKYELYTLCDDTKHLKSCINFPHYSNFILSIFNPLFSFPKQMMKQWLGGCSRHFPWASQTVTCFSPHWQCFPSLRNTSAQPAEGLPLSILFLVIVWKAKTDRQTCQTLAEYSHMTISFHFYFWQQITMNHIRYNIISQLISYPVPLRQRSFTQIKHASFLLFTNTPPAQTDT